MYLGLSDRGTYLPVYRTGLKKTGDESMHPCAFSCVPSWLLILFPDSIAFPRCRPSLDPVVPGSAASGTIEVRAAQVILEFLPRTLRLVFGHVDIIVRGACPTMGCSSRTPSEGR